MFCAEGLMQKHIAKVVWSDRILYAMTKWPAQNEQHKLVDAMKSHHSIILALWFI